MIIEKLTSFFVSPLFIKTSDKEISLGKGSIKLRDFQYELLKVFLNRESRDVVLLNAPTGAGKTLSLLIPLFANIEKEWMYYGSIGVYPSRELAKDQMISIYNLLVERGARELDIREFYKLKELNEDEIKIIVDYLKILEINVDGEYIPIILLYITSHSLNKLREIIGRYVEGISSNRALLEYLWSVARRAFRIVFTVPEYPYLIAGAVYQEFHRAGIWLHAVLKEFRRFLKVIEIDDKELFKKWIRELEIKIDRKRLSVEYDVSRKFLTEVANFFLLFRAPVFFDEFHLYSGFSLASFTSLLYIYLHEKGIGKIVISSATPVKIIKIKDEKRKDFLELVKELARKLEYEVKEVKASVSAIPRNGFDQIRKKTLIKIVPKVLEGRYVHGAPAFGVLQRYVPDILKETDWLERYREKGRSMILVDRVASVLEIAEAVEKLTGENPLVVCSVKELLSEGWLRPTEAELKKAKLVVGNMAIAFGIDIKGMDLGVVIAKDHLSALQKIGRYGRGEGKDVAEIYLPVPYSSYRKVRNLLKKIEGKEIPYVHSEEGASKSHEVDFITLLEEIYPKESPDILIRRREGIFKILFPAWVYTLANIIRLRSEIREELHTAKRIEDVEFLRNFVLLLKGIEKFFEIDALTKKLRTFIRERMNLTPPSLYYLYSYRNIAGVSVKKRSENGEIIEEFLNLATIGRNIPLKECINGEFWTDETRPPYEYTFLWVGVEEIEAEAFLKQLNDNLVILRFFIENLENFGGRAYILQGKRKICRIKRLLEGRYLTDIPVLVLHASDSKKQEFIQYLSATDSLIPIYMLEHNNEQGKLLGGIYLL